MKKARQYENYLECTVPQIDMLESEVVVDLSVEYYDLNINRNVTFFTEASNIVITYRDEEPIYNGCYCILYNMNSVKCVRQLRYL